MSLQLVSCDTSHGIDLQCRVHTCPPYVAIKAVRLIYLVYLVIMLAWLLDLKGNSQCFAYVMWRLECLVLNHCCKLGIVITPCWLGQLCPSKGYFVCTFNSSWDSSIFSSSLCLDIDHACYLSLLGAWEYPPPCGSPSWPGHAGGAAGSAWCQSLAAG